MIKRRKNKLQFQNIQSITNTSIYTNLNYHILIRLIHLQSNTPPQLTQVSY